MGHRGLRWKHALYWIEKGGGGPRYVAIMSERAVARTNISVDITRYVANGGIYYLFLFLLTQA